MNPLVILAIGLCIVLGGILWLRLHPFLALILGAFVVGAATSDSQLREAMASKIRGDLVQQAIESDMRQEALEQKQAGKVIDANQLREESRRRIRDRKLEFDESAERKAIDFVASHSLAKRITMSIGDTCQKLGLLIALACVIGRCLLASGGAERIVRGALGWVGERGAPIAFAASSFVLGIPVFFDSVFLLTIPLVKATWLKVRKNYLLYTLALVCGGTITHSLVPPTPGPLFAAQELGVNIGLMILVGTAVGLCCTSVGLLYAMWLNRRFDIPVRESPEALAELEKLSAKEIGDLPPLWLALTPVLLPVVLISGVTIHASLLDPSASVPPIIAMIGDTNIALAIATAIAMATAAIYLKNRTTFVDQIQQALQEAGLIILICCAGGAFGAMLQQSGIGPFISSMTGSKSLDFSLLPLAFLVSAIIRTAQGSSTVAMLTAVEVVRSLVPDLGDLSYHPVYLAVGIGCGSKPIPWMNDSGFWVISKMSGMTEQETLKTHTPMVSLMGCVGILVTMLAAKLVPLTN